MTILLMMIIFLITIASPLKVQVVLFVLNLIIPDPIPFVDEILQFAFILRKIFKD